MSAGFPRRFTCYVRVRLLDKTWSTPVRAAAWPRRRGNTVACDGRHWASDGWRVDVPRVAGQSRFAERKGRVYCSYDVYFDEAATVTLADALRLDDPTGLWWASKGDVLERPATMCEAAYGGVLGPDAKYADGWRLVSAFDLIGLAKAAPFDKDAPRCPNLRERVAEERRARARRARVAHAREMLARAETRLRRADTIARKWRRRVAGHEAWERAHGAGGKDGAA